MSSEITRICYMTLAARISLPASPWSWSLGPAYGVILFLDPVSCLLQTSDTSCRCYYISPLQDLRIARFLVLKAILQVVMVPGIVGVVVFWTATILSGLHRILAIDMEYQSLWEHLCHRFKGIWVDKGFIFCVIYTR